MPWMSKRTVPAAVRKNLNLDKEEGASPQPKKSMEDLPPEVVTIILEHLTWNESRNDILGYRRVNSQWKDIINSILERKITSGHFPAFPVMRVHPRNFYSRDDLLYVRHSSTMLPADRNPFPSNSLLLYGKGYGINPHYFPESVSDIQRMALANFMAKSGGYLTNLTLQNVVVPGMNSLVNLLSSLSSLKVLSLVTVYFDVSIIKSSLVFPTPPTLPNFTTLNVECGSGRSYTRTSGNEPGRLDEKRHILYVWLISSYADQLAHLNPKNGVKLPALEKGMQYFYCVTKESRLSIATTSDAAFRNLKELSTEHLSKLTIRDTELPKLQRISITGNEHFRFDIQDVTNFIYKCRSTLQKLRLDVPWATLTVLDDAFEKIMPPPLIGSPLPKLKTFEIQYSPDDERIDDIMISSFLVLFPALETLHILRFDSSNVTPAQELGTVNDEVGHADEVAAAKTGLAALEQRMHEKTMAHRQQRAALRPLPPADKWPLINELDHEMKVFRDANYEERTEIFKGLAALGVKRQDVVVELFLARQGIWNICPNLKVVSVSSGRNPTGDLCILRRPVVV